MRHGKCCPRGGPWCSIEPGLCPHPATAAGDSWPFPGRVQDPRQEGSHPCGPSSKEQQLQHSLPGLGGEWEPRGGESRARFGPQGCAGVTPARELVLNVSRCLSCCWGSAPAWHTQPMLPSDCAGTEGTLAMTTLVGLLCCNRIWNKDA